MSKQLNIHLFNCDGTYMLDIVEKWLNTARNKLELGIDFKVEQHKFSLSKMTELSSETIPGLQMDVAVFVVHAHESRLSINEENAGIGYAKLYRALLERTGDKVLIVIGGDDSYKDENEEDTAFISRWAKRKISSQFSEELIDGRKSFIFSWNQKHRPIHEEALVHFLDERKRGEKFEYHPKGKSSQVAETAMSRKADASTWERDPWGKKSTRGRNGSDATSQGTSASGDKPTERDTYPGASPGKGVTENRTPHTGKDDSSRQVGGSHPQGGIASFQRNASSMGNTPFQTRKEGSSRVNESNSPVGFDPLRSDTSRKASSSSGSTTPHSGNKGRFGRTGECDYSVESDPLERGTFGNSWSGIYPSLCSDTTDLSIIGWGASTEAMSAVFNLINRHRDVLSLSTDTDCFNFPAVNDVISYFEHNPLKYCVFVADADKIKAVLREERLLQIADRNVVKGIIITICCPWSEQEKSLEGAIKEAFHDSKKVKITWFENGYLKVNPDDVIHFLTSYQSTQEPSVAANRPPQSVMSKESLPLPWNYKIYLSSGKTVFALTHIRRGIISDKTNQAEDVQYWKPDFVVPWEIVDRLRKKNCKTSDAELAILMTEGGNLSCQVGKRSAKEWKNYITLGLDEIVVLQTKLKEGKISFEEKDLVIRYDMWRVPQNEVDRLQKDYKETRTADLFITSDPKGNSRCIVKVGASSKMFTFINTLYNQAVGKISNLI